MVPPAEEAIEVVLADDHDLVRSGIKALLLGIPGVTVTAEARNGQELLALLTGPLPDIVITDISMPGLDGLAALARIKASYPDLRVLVLSMYETADFIQRAVAAGACGYVLKSASAQELEQALRSIVRTGSYFSATVARQLLEPTEPGVGEQLTERQIEILTLMAEGLAAKEIGFRLGLSSKTVDAHRARIMDRLGINDVASLTLYALRKGLVQP
jgi:DNA-binding NarL/FixJ family response regulator